MSPTINRAVIWDMDGVIVDTGKYIRQAWQYTFKNHGFTLTDEDFRPLFGTRNDTIIRAVMGQDISQKELDKVAIEKERYYHQILKGNIKPLPGAVELIKLLPANGFSMAVASSAPKMTIELILKDIGVWDCFQANVAGREVVEGKPSPQIFLTAAERLGVRPYNCIVIEDATVGVEGAKRAGMKCVAVTNTHPRAALSGAGLVVDSLEAVTIADLEKLLNRKGK